MRGMAILAMVASLGATAFTIHGTVNRRDSIETLMVRRGTVVRDTSTSIWVIFRPEDCKIGDAKISTLNTMDSLGRVHVRGVMVDPPVDRTEQQRLLAAFGAHFDVAIDTSNKWRRAMAENGLKGPFYILRSEGKTIAILNTNHAKDASAFLAQF